MFCRSPFLWAIVGMWNDGDVLSPWGQGSYRSVAIKHQAPRVFHVCGLLNNSTASSEAYVVEQILTMKTGRYDMNDIQTKIIKWVVLFAVLLSFLPVSVLQAGTVDPNLASLIQTLDPAEEVALIVTLSDQVDLKKFKDKDKSLRRSKIIKALRDKADKSQVNLKKFLKDKKANKVISFWVFNGIAATIPANLVNELAGQSGVQSIQLDGTISQPQPALAGEAVPEWNLDLIRAPLLWGLGITGSGVVVANMDTGVDVYHPDLVANYRGGSNSWYDPHGEHSTPYDKHGHGTQTMGIMVGGSNGGTAIGVAPDAQWIAVKMFDDAGLASYSDIHLGFQWLLDPDDDPNTDDLPDVVNNSWNYRELVDQCFTEFQPDIQALKAAGVAVVFSAGNEGPAGDSSVSPANYPESLAVGSVDEFLFIADTSSRGPSACDGGLYPELVAPGVWVRTSDLTFGGVIPNSYAVVSGTSFAAPHVSGSMALLLNAQPNLTLMELESALTDSATDLGDLGQDNDYGNGLLNVAAAYDLIQSNTGSCSDVDGDGYNDNAPDHDGDGIPNGLDPDWQKLKAGKGKKKSNRYVDLDGDGINDYQQPGSETGEKEGDHLNSQKKGSSLNQKSKQESGQQKKRQHGKD